MGNTYCLAWCHGMSTQDPDPLHKTESESESESESEFEPEPKERQPSLEVKEFHTEVHQQL